MKNKKDDVVVIPQTKIKEVVLDPATNSIIILFKNNENIIIKNGRVIVQTKDGDAFFDNFDEFKKFIEENVGLKVLPGGQSH